MMMEGLLRDLDLDVVGPFGTVGEALEAVRHEAIDAALLDVNLGGEMAYPIARLLQAKNVPFVFMTGYGSETIAAPFSNIRIFQKPLERELLRDLFAPGPGQPERADIPGPLRRDQIDYGAGLN
jgi:CheY-like chemotaxis protein